MLSLYRYDDGGLVEPNIRLGGKEVVHAHQSEPISSKEQKLESTGT